MDKFTSSTLLGMLSVSKDNDPVADLYKDIKRNSSAIGISHVLYTYITENIGRECYVHHAGYKAVIHSANTSTSGFYTGDRYPIYIKIVENNGGNPQLNCVGAVFEYSPDEIVLSLDNGGIAFLSDIEEGYDVNSGSISKHVKLFIAKKSHLCYKLKNTQTVIEIIDVTENVSKPFRVISSDDNGVLELGYGDIDWFDRT